MPNPVQAPNANMFPVSIVWIETDLLTFQVRVPLPCGAFVLFVLANV